MKGVLRWLCGPVFRFYRQDDPCVSVTGPAAGRSGNRPLQRGRPRGHRRLKDTAWPFYDPATQSVLQEFYLAYLQFGESIKLLHQAVEWENVSYVLYPYFWTDIGPEPPDWLRWDFKQSLYHSDFVHRTFLRAGAARVVLSIRPGFEKAFLSFMEGELAGSLPGDHVYMSIADELEAMAKTNYPYTADANLDKEDYVFTWDNVPGSESGRLKRQLRQNFYIAWAEEDATTITKSDDNNTIQVAIDIDLRLMSSVSDASSIPTSGTNLVIVADVKGVLHFRSFDADGKVVVDTDETSLTTQAGPIADLKRQLESLWPPHELTRSEKDRVIAAVTSIVGHTLQGQTRMTGSVSIELKEDEGVAVLKVTEGKSYDLRARQESGEWKVYRLQNLVDTWYEFTPTGAMDIVEGKVI